MMDYSKLRNLFMGFVLDDEKIHDLGIWWSNLDG